MFSSLNLSIERVWGGSQFYEIFEPRLNRQKKYGESWNLVDREDDQSFCTTDLGKESQLVNFLENKDWKSWDQIGKTVTNFQF